MQWTGKLSISTGTGTEAEAEASRSHWVIVEINNPPASVTAAPGMVVISKYHESNRQS